MSASQHPDGAPETAVLAALAEERTRLADALHDGPLTQLVLARLSVADALDGDPAELALLGERLDEISRQLHCITGGLHEESLDELPLEQAITRIALGLRSRLEVALDIEAAATPHHATLVRQAARELLNNAAQHAGATTVTVALALVGAELRLTVEDDGRGTDGSAVAQARASGHLGVQRLERAAARLGGTFVLVPRAPHGTTATLRLPVRAPTPREGRLTLLSRREPGTAPRMRRKAEPQAAAPAEALVLTPRAAMRARERAVRPADVVARPEG